MNNTKKTIDVDIGGTRIKIAIINDGKVEKFTTILSHSEGKLSDRLDDMKKAIEEITDGDYKNYVGIGVGMPCLVNSEKKRATEIYSKFEDAPSLDMEKWSMDNFGLPIIMEQDSKAALLGENQYGCAKNYNNIVMLIMGTGVGTAVMSDGRLLKGKNYAAGSLGSHIIIDINNGRKCTCPGSGCLEAYTSGWALPGLIKDHENYKDSILYNEKDLNFKNLKEAVLKGDKTAKDVFELIIKAMRAGIISFIHAYDPEALILSGGPINMGEIFTKPLLQDINKYIWGKDRTVDFLIAEKPDESVVLGLHYLMIERSCNERV